MKPFILLFILIITVSGLSAQPPYSGTIFIDPDIMTETDPSALQSTTYTGQGMVTMYDRRIPDWVTVNAFLFDVVWDDGIISVAQVNPEFGSIAAAEIEAEKYAYLIGQLPSCLREDVNEIWIHQGVEAFGGGNNSILIHTGQSVLYENDGIIEETLVHEACHTSLDADHAASAGWLDAQMLDDEFISDYAKDNPTREDIAESYLTWLAVRYRQDSISVADYNKITQAIPNRLNYFDSITCDLYPFVKKNTSITTFDQNILDIHPNPTTGILYVDSENISGEAFRILNLLGQDLTSMTTISGNQMDLSRLPSGPYIIKGRTMINKVYKQ